MIYLKKNITYKIFDMYFYVSGTAGTEASIAVKWNTGGTIIQTAARVVLIRTAALRDMALVLTADPAYYLLRIRCFPGSCKVNKLTIFINHKFLEVPGNFCVKFTVN
jgi:hypothetical protein